MVIKLIIKIDIVNSFCCSLDGKYLISGNSEYSIKVWNIDSLITETKIQYAGHNGNLSKCVVKIN